MYFDQKSVLDIIKQNRIQILEIAMRHGAERVRAFGSVVRKEEQPDSDIDFLVKMHTVVTLRVDTQRA